MSSRDFGVHGAFGGLLSPKCVGAALSELIEIKTTPQMGVEVVAFFLVRPGVKLKALPELLSWHTRFC